MNYLQRQYHTNNNEKISACSEFSYKISATSKGFSTFFPSIQFLSSVFDRIYNTIFRKNKCIPVLEFRVSVHHVSSRACRYSPHMKAFPHCRHSRILFTVCSHMFAQGRGIPEGLPAVLTLIRFLPSVCPHMHSQVVRIPEGFPTLLTLIGFHPSV